MEVVVVVVLVVVVIGCSDEDLLFTKFEMVLLPRGVEIVVVVVFNGVIIEGEFMFEAVEVAAEFSDKCTQWS